MTNLQQGAPRLEREHLQRLWLGVPIAAGALLATLLTAFVLVPLGSGVRRDALRLQELQALRDQVPLLRRQLAALDATEEKVDRQQARLFELVTGSGDLSTFVSALDQEARAAGVQLRLYEPQAAPQAGEEAPAGGRPGQRRGSAAEEEQEARKKAAAEPGAALLEVEGLQRRSVLVSARGSFPALLRFLRGVEERNLLVVQSDLQLLLQEAQQQQDQNAPPRPEPVELKLLMSLYEKTLTASPPVRQEGSGTRG
ncbi:MAG: hypothetical protein VKI81_01435 [Synechococcaceae cyanobacterium]|nr:hypothetical protein [Synechococcaceae cyanobacterium]